MNWETWEYVIWIAEKVSSTCHWKNLGMLNSHLWQFLWCCVLLVLAVVLPLHNVEFWGFPESKNVWCVLLGCDIIWSCTYTVLEPKLHNLKCPTCLLYCRKKESEDLGPLSAFNLEVIQHFNYCCLFIYLFLFQIFLCYVTLQFKFCMRRNVLCLGTFCVSRSWHDFLVVCF
jgi:hypothetical protein